MDAATLRQFEHLLLHRLAAAFIKFHIVNPGHFCVAALYNTSIYNPNLTEPPGLPLP